MPVNLLSEIEFLAESEDFNTEVIKTDIVVIEKCLL